VVACPPAWPRFACEEPGHEPERCANRAQRQHCKGGTLLRQISSKRRRAIPGQLEIKVTPVAKANYWLVTIAWPNETLHFVGKFQTKAEAEKWIERHPRMTEQRQEPDLSPRVEESR
jgi:hypothetical protein